MIKGGNNTVLITDVPTRQLGLDLAGCVARAKVKSVGRFRRNGNRRLTIEIVRTRSREALGVAGKDADVVRRLKGQACVWQNLVELIIGGERRIERTRRQRRGVWRNNRQCADWLAGAGCKTAATVWV